MTQCALIISGGGARAAFAAGAVKQLLQHHPDTRFDLCCGTGSGSLVSVLTATGETALMEKFFTSTETTDFITTSNIKQRFINNSNSLYTTIPLSQRISSLITESRFHIVMEADTEVCIACKCLQTGRITYFSTKQDTIATADYDVVKISGIQCLREAIVASFSRPVFMPPVEISMVTETTGAPLQFAEAGGIGYHPFKLAISKGITEIYAILPLPEQQSATTKQFKNVIDILEQTIDQSVSIIDPADIQAVQLYNNMLQYMDAVRSRLTAAGIDPSAYLDIPEGSPFQQKKHINIRLIRPGRPLDTGMGGLEFNRGYMKEMMGFGYSSV
ncbi:MAG TPA: patatin-like phospholipase family protein [Chitinophaga sp.]|uniref:patatin-like phospholipase family protein n=1 Tax=Chitinophaga sp. TaxID=1869181 RepID=UPI002B7A9194|nr:patatin-like phospholipase family protein [Chitinophaga sp.]HVI46596.1 patatin-like phospholipase family protein [Chitinophaga sp.]